jgi:hypothetical protein
MSHASPESLEKQIRRVADDFLESLKEEVDSAVFLRDSGRLQRLVSAVHAHLDAEIVRVIREKGFDKELRELCDRVGKEGSESDRQDS